MSVWISEQTDVLLPTTTGCSYPSPSVLLGPSGLFLIRSTPHPLQWGCTHRLSPQFSGPLLRSVSERHWPKTGKSEGSQEPDYFFRFSLCVSQRLQQKLGVPWGSSFPQVGPPEFQLLTYPGFLQPGSDRKALLLLISASLLLPFEWLPSSFFAFIVKSLDKVPHGLDT